MPGAIAKGYVSTREPMLKDEYDEWLARVVCFAFSIAPSALTRQMNRATAATVQEAALGEGLAPLLRWVKQLIDRVIAEEFGWLDLEFAWIDAPALSPLEQARIHELHVRSGIKTVDEVRAELGLDPLGDRGGAEAREQDGKDREEGEEEGKSNDDREPDARAYDSDDANAIEATKHAPKALSKYSPLQPRVPRGDPAGGQWTTDGGGSLRIPATVRKPLDPLKPDTPLEGGGGGGRLGPAGGGTSRAPSAPQAKSPPSGSGPGSLTREDLIGASTRRPSSDKNQQIYDLPGGWEKANEYFDRLPRSGDVRIIERPEGTMRVIQQPDGTTVNIRPFSSGRKRTIEFIPPEGSANPVIKFRIGE